MGYFLISIPFSKAMPRSDGEHLESRSNRFRLGEGQLITRGFLRVSNVKPVAHDYRMVPRLAFQPFEGGYLV